MPTYEYHCSNQQCECDTFQTHQSIKEEPLKTCPFCGEESIERVIHAVAVMVRGEPKTLGALADLNRKKFGENYCQEKQNEYKEQMLNANAFTGRLPKGATVQKRERKDTPWRKANEPVDLSLAKMNKNQKEKYIITGQKSKL